MPTFKVICRNETQLVAPTGLPKYHDDQALHDVVSYCLDYEKIPNHFVGSYGINPNHADLEMELLARAYGKASGLRLRHFVLAFSPDEVKRFHSKVNETLLRIAWYAAGYYGGEYQIIFAVHEDTENPHIHFVMNTVSYLTGRKYRGDKADYYQFQSYLGQFLMEQYGLYLIPVKDQAE